MSVKSQKFTRLAIALVVIVLAGCTGGDTPTAPPEGDPAYTQAAQTIAAQLTEVASKVTAPPVVSTPVAAALNPSPTFTFEPLPPTSTPLPTNTPVPTDTPPPTNTPVPTNTPIPTNTFTATSPPGPTFKVVFQDSFNGNTGWWKEDLDNVFYHFPVGGYAIMNKAVEAAAFSVRTQLNLLFPNVRVEVRGSRTQGPLDGYYGLICRFADGSNFYILAVGSDGWYGIGKKKAGNLTFLREGLDTSVIYTGNTPNFLQADCVGDTLTLYANGVELLKVQDTDFSAGAVGVAVGTRKRAGYEALFDDFSLFVAE